MIRVEAEQNRSLSREIRPEVAKQASGKNGGNGGGNDQDDSDADGHKAKANGQGEDGSVSAVAVANADDPQGQQRRGRSVSARAEANADDTKRRPRRRRSVSAKTEAAAGKASNADGVSAVAGAGDKTVVVTASTLRGALEAPTARSTQED